MSEEGLKMFLFLLQGRDGCELKESFVAVKQAHIDDVIADSTERVGRFGVIFTTRMEMAEVNEKLNMKKEPYLVIELTGNVTTESIAGFFPNTDITELKSLNLENLKRSAEWLENELNEAVFSENYEKAAKLKKEIEEKTQ